MTILQCHPQITSIFILGTNFEYLEAMEEYKNGLNVKIYIVTSLNHGAER